MSNVSLFATDTLYLKKAKVNNSSKNSRLNMNYIHIGRFFMLQVCRKVDSKGIMGQTFA